MSFITVKSKVKIEFDGQIQEGGFVCQGKIDGNTITFKPSYWAPGIWAGSEGFNITVEGKIRIVDKVDLKNRTIELLGEK